VTDLPHLPPSWAWSTVTEVGDVQLGRQRAPRYHTGASMRPYLRVANVFEDRIDTSDVMSMHFEPEEFERYRLAPGDILLNEGQSPELLGRPALYRGTPADVAFTNSLIRFRAYSGIEPEWALIVFRYYMRSGRFTREARITTNIAHLSANRFKTVEFPVPPLEEQQRIVAVLKERLSELDRANGEMVPLGQHLERLEEGVIHAAGLGRLLPATPSATPADVHLAAALDGIPMPDTPDLPSLPAGWVWTTLGAICDVMGGVTKDSKKQGDPNYMEVPYLRVANVQKGRLNLDQVARIRVPQAKAEALRLLPGDVLFNEGGDRDKLGRGWVWDGQIPDCIHQNHVFRGRIRGGVLDPRLLSWHGNTFGRRWFEAAGKQTTNLASLSMTNLKRLPVPVPPLEEQPLIVAELQRRLSIIQAARRDLAGVRQKAQLLVRSLMRTAVTGHLVEQNPETESGELLLKRIAEDRAVAALSAHRRRSRSVSATGALTGAAAVEESA
jgi:type I restriction enzyme S subunit